ncbi:MAG TPA: UDP binding domain-containing protein, partial [Crocinitomicaceae bacterium]|nr:UDP binding domain-containing protein [Crocinitomicaceae bacterium]
GGSCFPKDVQALVKSGKEVGFDFEILEAVMKINESQKTVLMPKIKNYFRGNLTGKHFAIWGLAFKPNTDDIREAPALYMIDALLQEGATVTAYDPEAMENVKAIYGDKIQFVENEYQALENADALVICTEWSIFRNPDFTKVGATLKDKVIFDGRNLFETEQMNEKGFYYESIGRKTVE